MAPRQRRGGHPRAAASSRASPGGARIMAAAAFPPLPAVAGPALRRAGLPPPSPSPACPHRETSHSGEGWWRAPGVGEWGLLLIPLPPHRRGGRAAASRPAAAATWGRARPLAPRGPKWRHRLRWKGSCVERAAAWRRFFPKGAAPCALRAPGGGWFPLARPGSAPQHLPPQHLRGRREAVGWPHRPGLKGGLHWVEN